MSFPAQKQTVLGQQNRMTPVPDCGEDSCRGAGKLTGLLSPRLNMAHHKVFRR
jgi:hypothetical protein